MRTIPAHLTSGLQVTAAPAHETTSSELGTTTVVHATSAPTQVTMTPPHVTNAVTTSAHVTATPTELQVTTTPAHVTRSLAEVTATTLPTTTTSTAKSPTIELLIKNRQNIVVATGKRLEGNEIHGHELHSGCCKVLISNVLVPGSKSWFPDQFGEDLLETGAIVQWPLHHTTCGDSISPF